MTCDTAPLDNVKTSPRLGSSSELLSVHWRLGNFWSKNVSFRPIGLNPSTRV